jgi:hypothetical protein
MTVPSLVEYARRWPSSEPEKTTPAIYTERATTGARQRRGGSSPRSR